MEKFVFRKIRTYFLFQCRFLLWQNPRPRLMGQSGTNQPKQRRFQSLFFFFAASLDLHSSSIFLFLSLLPRKSPLPLLFHQSFLFLFFPSLPCEEEPQSAKKEREYSGSLFLLLPLLFPLPTTKRGAPPPSSSSLLDGSPSFPLPFHACEGRPFFVGRSSGGHPRQ